MSSLIKCAKSPEQLCWHHTGSKGVRRGKPEQEQRNTSCGFCWELLQTQNSEMSKGKSHNRVWDAETALACSSIGETYCKCRFLEIFTAFNLVFWLFPQWSTQYILHLSPDEDRGSAQPWLLDPVWVLLEDKFPGFALQEQEEQAGLPAQPQTSLAGRTGGWDPCARDTCTCASPQQPLLLPGCSFPCSFCSFWKPWKACVSTTCCWGKH